VRGFAFAPQAQADSNSLLLLAVPTNISNQGFNGIDTIPMDAFSG
jgi:hypothetical protein